MPTISWRSTIWWRSITWWKVTIIFNAIALEMACRSVRVKTGEWKVVEIKQLHLHLLCPRPPPHHHLILLLCHHPQTTAQEEVHVLLELLHCQPGIKALSLLGSRRRVAAAAGA